MMNKGRKARGSHLDNVLRDYERIAGFYDTHWSDYTDAVHDWIITKMRENQAPQSLLDIGCGTGMMLKCLSNEFPSSHLTGLDTTPSMLKLAKENCPDAYLVETNVDKDWPLCGELRWDAVLSLSVLHHLEDHEAHFHRLHHYCSKDGAVYLADFALDSLPMTIGDIWWKISLPSYVKAYSSKRLEHLIQESGFFEITEQGLFKPNNFWRVQTYRLSPLNKGL